MTQKKTENGEKKKARRGLAELNPADREMAVMRRARAALTALETPEARIRVVNWLQAVVFAEARPAPIAPTAANQMTLDDVGKDVFP